MPEHGAVLNKELIIMVWWQTLRGGADKLSLTVRELSLEFPKGIAASAGVWWCIKGMRLA
jgi:hypothetical protein